MLEGVWVIVLEFRRRKKSGINDLGKSRSDFDLLAFLGGIRAGKSLAV
jgi:hypothetical protein